MNGNSSRPGPNGRPPQQANINAYVSKDSFSHTNSSLKHEQTAQSKQFQPVQYTSDEQARIQTQLDRVLGPEWVSFRPGGGGANVSYIEGWRAINLANEIFGFNGWNSEFVSSQVDYLDQLSNGRVSIGLSVIVRITLKDGTYHEDFGYGFIDNAKTKAQAFEKCKKEAITDGIKRCLRCFGNVLGNCLYDKTILQKMQKVKLPAPDLTLEDFHRDPLIARREQQKKQTTSMSIPDSAKITNLHTNSAMQQIAAPIPSTIKPRVPSAPPQTPNSASAAARQVPVQNAPLQARKPSDNYTPAASNVDLADFDDSFTFSDDIPTESQELNDGLDEYEIELLRANGAQKQAAGDTPIPEPVKPAVLPGPAAQVKVPSTMLFVSAKRADVVQKSPEEIANLPQFDAKFISPGIKRTVDPNKSVPVKRNDASQSASLQNRLNLAPAGTKRMIGMPQSQRPKRVHKDVGDNKENATTVSQTSLVGPGSIAR